jgi:hypothetical protein
MLTIVDASVVVAALEHNDAHHEAASDALTESAAAGSVLLPASAYAESLVHPMQHRETAADEVDAFWTGQRSPSSRSARAQVVKLPGSAHCTVLRSPMRSCSDSPLPWTRTLSSQQIESGPGSRCAWSSSDATPPPPAARAAGTTPP